MTFISAEFAILLAVCFLLYNIVPGRFRKYILLVASCIFIGYTSLMFLAAAVAVGLFSYGAGIALENSIPGGKSRAVFWTAVSLLLVGWTGFSIAGRSAESTGIIFPAGISFYTFQAISYLTEIYWEEEKAERDMPSFMVYMLLFMKFLSGPIERPGDLLPQIRKSEDVSYGSMSYGMKLILVGLLKKLALAGHIAPYVDRIFDSVHSASGVQLLMAALLYPVELYADFSGYTDIAMGTAMLFGLRLTQNFRQPFHACTTSDFWRRWHISLSFWVRDYLYYPLSSATRRWGRYGVAASLLTTFMLLGIWHGVGWNFLVYGLIQGLIILWEMKTQGIRDKFRKKAGNIPYTAYSVIRTYLIFAFSLIFFKSANLGAALDFIRNISFRTAYSWKEINIGMSDHICIVAGAALLLVALYDYFMSRGDLLSSIGKCPAAARWAIYYIVAIAVLAYGNLGTENFIYMQF